MRDERYTIVVADDYVEISGTLTIRETFDFLNFFEREGFNCVEDGFHESALFIRKRNFEQEKKDFIVQEHLELEKEYENKFNELQEKHTTALERIRDLEHTIKLIIEDQKLKNQQYAEIKKEIDRNKSLEKLNYYVSTDYLKEFCLTIDGLNEYENLKNYFSHVDDLKEKE